MKEQIKILQESFKKAFQSCASLVDLDELQHEFLGRKGKLTHLMKQVSKVDASLRAEIGQLINRSKRELETLIKQKQQQLKEAVYIRQIKGEFYDFTLPATADPAGSLHPISLVQYELEDVFNAMGFEVMDGPHIESDYYNFEALNFPPNHPARDMQDTFYLSNGMLLRTQTSTIQIRAMEKRSLPLRVVGPGKVFRAERVDASHSPVFHQIEGLVVDTNITVSHMVYFLRLMLSEVFKKELKVRIRPGYFPFVEPGFELEMGCLICEGAGCSACKNIGWVEILGCGLVHPNVLRKGKIDPQNYSGFAFGMGIDRLAMMKYAISDIRMLHGGDLSLAKQFSSPS